MQNSRFGGATSSKLERRSWPPMNADKRKFEMLSIGVDPR
jgi:hypothetical protein